MVNVLAIYNGPQPHAGLPVQTGEAYSLIVRGNQVALLDDTGNWSYFSVESFLDDWTKIESKP